MRIHVQTRRNGTIVYTAFIPAKVAQALNIVRGEEWSCDALPDGLVIRRAQSLPTTTAPHSAAQTCTEEPQ